MRPLTILKSYFIIKLVNSADAYRLEALLELAASSPASLTAREIARRRRIPATFLARLLGELAHDGLVVTVRGPRGGVRLGAPPGEIRLADVLRSEACQESGGAAVRWLERRLGDAQRQALAPLTLAALLEVERERGAAFGYEI